MPECLESFNLTSQNLAGKNKRDKFYEHKEHPLAALALLTLLPKVKVLWIT